MLVQNLDPVAAQVTHAEAAPTLTGPGPRAERDVVQSLVRALDILELLSVRACRLTELAQRAKLPASTTHRLLTTMERKRFVSFDREENLWYVSSHCYAIGAGFLRRETLFTQAAPFLNALASQVGAVANLGILEGGQLIIVRQAVGCGQAPVQPPGACLPLHATAMGKILLAEGASPMRSQRSFAGPLPRLTSRTICDAAMFSRELTDARARGIAMEDEESLEGRRCVAAPVRDASGQCVAAVSVTSTSAMMTKGSIELLRTRLSTAVGQISRGLQTRGRESFMQLDARRPTRAGALEAGGSAVGA